MTVLRRLAYFKLYQNAVQYADELRVRGLACERAADALTEHPSSNP